MMGVANFDEAGFVSGARGTAAPLIRRPL